MVRVEFLGPIKKEPLEVAANSLAELANILAKDSALKEWLDISAVAVNDTIIKSKEYPLQNGDVVSILPPVCGG